MFIFGRYSGDRVRNRVGTKSKAADCINIFIKHPAVDQMSDQVHSPGA